MTEERKAKKNVRFQNEAEEIKLNSTQWKPTTTKAKKEKKKGRSPARPTSSAKGHQSHKSSDPILKSSSSKSPKGAGVRHKAARTRQDSGGKGSSKTAHPSQPKASKFPAGKEGGNQPTKFKGKVSKLPAEDKKKSVDIKRTLSCSSQKEVLIEKANKDCYICNANSEYFKGCFFCEMCKTRFNNVVKEAASIGCSIGGKCFSQHACDFCVAEIFYAHGIKAADVSGFHHISYTYKTTYKTSPEETENLPLNREEKEFCKLYNRILNDVLDWVWKQGDLLKLPANDRLAIIETNAGRARLMWIVADLMPRHDVIKTVDSYLPISKFSSDIVRQTAIGINDLAIYFRSLNFTPQHMYFMKLLAIFQIGKTVSCSRARSAHPKCVFGENNFEKVDEITLIRENYQKILQLMKVREDELQRIREKIDLMHCMNMILSQQNEIEDIDMRFPLWIAENPEWKKQQLGDPPSAIESYPKERLELCNYLNKICIPSLNCASECLNYFVSSRDKKELLRRNMMPVIVANICWNKEATTDYKDVNKIDKIVKIFYQLLNEIQDLLHKDLSKYFSLTDFMMLCLTRPFSGSDVKLKDINIKDLHQNAKHAALETVERQLKKQIRSKTEQQHQFAHLQNILDTIIENTDKAAAILEISNKTLPMFVDVSNWMSE